VRSSRTAIDLRLAHTADAGQTPLKAARELLHLVFGDEMTDEDWEHALGGIHAFAWARGQLVGHASVVQRRLLHGGRALRTGYIEGVGVHPERRGQGYGAAVMASLERVVHDAYELGALGASDEGARFYASRGWLKWRGATWALTPSGTVRTAEEDDSVYVLPVSAKLDLAGDLTCDYRDGELW